MQFAQYVCDRLAASPVAEGTRRLPACELLVNQISDQSFGLLIAYLLPGFLALLGLSPHFPTIDTWLGATAQSQPTVGGFLYVTLASIGAGLTVSTVRWLALDHVHHLTGLHPPKWDVVAVQAHFDAFQAAVTYHYRYYQFYGNSLLALLVLVIGRWPLGDSLGTSTSTAIVVTGCLASLLVIASRDALSKYYARTSVFLPVSSHPKETRDD